jgi:hypothetical protein
MVHKSCLRINVSRDDPVPRVYSVCFGMCIFASITFKNLPLLTQFVDCYLRVHMFQ